MLPTAETYCWNSSMRPTAGGWSWRHREAVLDMATPAVRAASFMYDRVERRVQSSPQLLGEEAAEPLPVTEQQDPKRNGRMHVPRKSDSDGWRSLAPRVTVTWDGASRLEYVALRAARRLAEPREPEPQGTARADRRLRCFAEKWTALDA